MAALQHPDYVADRGDAVAASTTVNGLRRLLVSLDPDANPPGATLHVECYNALHLPAILLEIAATPSRLTQIFRVRGGMRVRAGAGPGEVRVTGVAAVGTTMLDVTVAPVGDYSPYTLELVWDGDRIDPFFARLDFKFRPGCFTNDCRPGWEAGRPPQPVPQIDYLARDYDSFRHTLIAAMMERVPGWQATSEADLDQVLIGLFAAAGDELADYQDRVMNEAYLGTARSRVSVARHARLVDYHIHQGNQASTWLAVEVAAGTAPFTLGDTLDDELVVWTGPSPPAPDAVFFATRQRVLDAAERQVIEALANRFRLHTWGEAQPALAAGSTSADLELTVLGTGQLEAEQVRDRIRDGTLRELLIAEALNPLTGREPGRNPRKRQVLRLVTGPAGVENPDAAEALLDPVLNVWVVRVHWRDEDALQFDYSFTTFCADTGPAQDVSLFHGNLLPIHAGRPVAVAFHEPSELLPDDDAVLHRHFAGGSRDPAAPADVLCELPAAPLAYLPTPPGGEVPPLSTLRVAVHLPGAVTESVWDEQPNLVHSDGSAEEGDHFMVETDELQRSTLRFGDGTNGRWLPIGSPVACEYQVGGGTAGNVGADALVSFRDLPAPLAGLIERVWNPRDVVDGRDPEPVETIRRAAPEAYRARQLRAVTLADYVRRAEEVPGVAAAAARYAWSGSWRTVRVVIDPVGTTVLDTTLRAAVAAHLEAVRLIGEDIELRPPRYVPLEIAVVVCAAPEYWREDLRYVLEQEFSASWTPDGRRGFFHPDEWTFGEPLHASAIAGRVHAVTGVEHIVSIAMKRFNAPGATATDVLEIAPDEIMLVASDPDALERGFIRFDVQGGRQ